MKYTIRYLTHYQKAGNDALVLGLFVLGCVGFCFAMSWLLGEPLPYKTLPLAFFIYIFVVLPHVRKRRLQRDKDAPVSG